MKDQRGLGSPKMNRRNLVVSKLDVLGRQHLAHLPTPLEPMTNLTRVVGGAQMFVKRDDCTGLGFGGNKVRQLEFYLGAAEPVLTNTMLGS